MREQFPVEPLQFLPQTPRIPFEEGMRLLQEAGFQVLLWRPHSSMPIAQMLHLQTQIAVIARQRSTLRKHRVSLRPFGHTC